MINIRYLLCTTMLLSGSSLAEIAEQGLSGEIGVFGGYTNYTSNFNTETSATINSLEQSGKSDSSGELVPLASFRYQFGDNQIFLGQSEDTFVKGILALEMGYKRQMDRNSTVSLSYAPTVVEGKTWANPYDLNTKRTKTDIKGDAFRLKYEFLSLTTNFVYYNRKLDKEHSGNSQGISDILDRNGDGYLGKLNVGLPVFADSFIEPYVFYRKDNADGKAMAYDRIGGGITCYVMHGNSTFVLDSRYSQADFDALNPLFSKTRKDDSWAINASYEYLGLFAIPDLSLTTQLSYAETDSNIQFYDEKEHSVMVGSMYHF